MKKENIIKTTIIKVYNIKQYLKLIYKVKK